MFNLSPVELLLILAVVLIFIGPGKLPETGAAIGKAMRGFRQAVEGKEPNPADEPVDPANPFGQAAAAPPVAGPTQAGPYPSYPGQPYPAQPYPAQPYPAQPYPQPYGGAPYPQQPYPAQPYPQQPPVPAPAAPEPVAAAPAATRDETAG